jgi:hypothetical protein
MDSGAYRRGRKGEKGPEEPEEPEGNMDAGSELEGLLRDPGRKRRL